MPVETLVSLEEYLNTSYEPDCDYVDGVLLERNVGKFDHSRMQFLLAGFLGNVEKELGLIGVTEQRMKVGSKRIRIPDLCVLLQNQSPEQVLNTPPFLCIEILSPEDTMTGMQERIDDYVSFGVPFVWIVDPRRRKSYIVREHVMTELTDGILRTSDPEIVVPIDQMYGG